MLLVEFECLEQARLSFGTFLRCRRGSCRGQLLQTHLQLLLVRLLTHLLEDRKPMAARNE